MVFIDINSREKTGARQIAFLLAVLGTLLTIVVYFGPDSQFSSQPSISVEEVETVHVLLDKIQTEMPALTTQVENYRLSFSQDPRTLPHGFFQADADGQRLILLKDIVAKTREAATNEVAVTPGSRN